MKFKVIGVDMYGDDVEKIIDASTKHEATKKASRESINVISADPLEDDFHEGATSFSMTAETTPVAQSTMKTRYGVKPRRGRNIGFRVRFSMVILLLDAIAFVVAFLIRLSSLSLSDQSVEQTLAAYGALIAAAVVLTLIISFIFRRLRRRWLAVLAFLLLVASGIALLSAINHHEDLQPSLMKFYANVSGWVERVKGMKP